MYYASTYKAVSKSRRNFRIPVTYDLTTINCCLITSFLILLVIFNHKKHSMYLENIWEIGSLACNGRSLFMSNVSGSNWNLGYWFVRSEKNKRIWKKFSEQGREKNNRLNRRDARSWNQTWATALKGERPRQYAIPAFTINRKKNRAIK